MTAWTTSDILADLDRRGWTREKLIARAEHEARAACGAFAAFDYSKGREHNDLASKLLVLCMLWTDHLHTKAGLPPFTLGE